MTMEKETKVTLQNNHRRPYYGLPPHWIGSLPPKKSGAYQYRARIAAGGIEAETMGRDCRARLFSLVRSKNRRKIEGTPVTGPFKHEG